MVKTVVPNVNSNPQLNYGGASINMIKTEDEWCTVKEIVPFGPDNLEKVVASPSIIEKYNFTSMTSHQVVASVSREGQNGRQINHVPPTSLPHLGESLPVEKCAKDDGLGEGIGDHWEKGDDAPKKIIETLGIRDAKPMERVLN